MGKENLEKDWRDILNNRLECARLNNTVEEQNTLEVSTSPKNVVQESAANNAAAVYHEGACNCSITEATTTGEISNVPVTGYYKPISTQIIAPKIEIATNKATILETFFNEFVKVELLPAITKTSASAAAVGVSVAFTWNSFGMPTKQSVIIKDEQLKGIPTEELEEKSKKETTKVEKQESFTNKTVDQQRFIIRIWYKHCIKGYPTAIKTNKKLGIIYLAACKYRMPLPERKPEQSQPKNDE